MGVSMHGDNKHSHWPQANVHTTTIQPAPQPLDTRKDRKSLQHTFILAASQCTHNNHTTSAANVGYTQRPQVLATHIHIGRKPMHTQQPYNQRRKRWIHAKTASPCNTHSYWPQANAHTTTIQPAPQTLDTRKDRKSLQHTFILAASQCTHNNHTTSAANVGYTQRPQVLATHIHIGRRPMYTQQPYNQRRKRWIHAKTASPCNTHSYWPQANVHTTTI